MSASPPPAPESSRLEQDGPGAVKGLKLSSHSLDTGWTRSHARSPLPHGPGSAVHGLHDFRELRRAPGLSFPMCKTSNREDLRSVSKHCLMSQLLYL